MAVAALPKFGIDFVGDIPWGAHLCQFYETKHDLSDILVPYFAEGLKSNEACVWITSEPLEAEEATAALKKAVPDIDRFIKNGQLLILPFTEWYLKDGTFDADRVLQGWIEKEQEALSRGFEGLRLTGNTFWIGRSLWKPFTDYEEVINKVLRAHRIIALCTYSLRNCSGGDVVDVVRNHGGTIIKKGAIWSVVEDVALRKEAEVALQETHEEVQSLNTELQSTNVELRVANETLEERVKQRTEKLESYIEQLQRHKMMVDLASEGIIIFDVEDHITYWNHGAERLYGWSADEAHGMKIHSFMQTESPTRLDLIRRTLLEKGVWHGELTHVTKQGVRIVVESYQTLQRDAAGNPTAIFEINTDVTDRKQAEEQLRAASLYARSLIEASLDPLVTISADGKITDVNHATEGVTGRSREELIGSDFRDYFTEPGKANAGYKRVFTDGFVRDYPLAIRHKLGNITDVLYNATLFKNEQGEIQGVFAAARDITDRKRADEQLRSTSLYTRSLIEASLDPLVTISVDGKVTDVNKATEEVTGRFREELIGSDFSDYFTEPEEARKGYEQVFADGFVRDYPLAIRHTSGTVTDVLYNATVYRNEAGEIQGVFAAARDITDRKQAEQQLRATSLYARGLIEASLDPLVTIDAEGKITDVNEATEDVTGCSRNELIGSDFSNYFTNSKNARKGYRRVFARGFVRDYPLAIRHNSGRITEVLYNATLFKNELNDIQGVFAAARDVTERKAAEKKLKAQARRTSVLNEIIRVINKASDLPSLFGQALATTTERLGFVGGFIATEDESGHLKVRYAHNLPPAFVKSLDKIVFDNNLDIRDAHRKGKPVIVDAVPADTLAARCGMQGAVVSLPIFSEGALIGEFTMYAERPQSFALEERNLLLTIATEFGTALSKLEAQEAARRYASEAAQYSAHLEELVEERSKQLKDAERLTGIGETAAMIGHDLRNPLQGLQYIVDLHKLRYERMSAEQQSDGDWQKEAQLFSKISEQVFYMDKIVGDLQDYARPIGPEPEMVALSILINEVIASLPRADHVDIVTDVDNLEVNVDPHLMHRVFANLLLNAMQAMPDGGKLTISASAQDAAVAIAVTDTGVGIPDEMRGKLFSPLMTGKAKGTGLGLAVVKRIVDAHGGTIDFESEEAKGTTFTVTLPAT
jgi:PAS domain S-box-containing protein